MPRLLYMVQVGSQQYRKMCKSFSFSYLSCGQIWLNLPKDDCHFGYITKLTGKILYISLCGTCFFSYCMIMPHPPPLSRTSRHASALSCISLPQCTRHTPNQPLWPKKCESLILLFNTNNTTEKWEQLLVTVN